MNTQFIELTSKLTQQVDNHRDLSEQCEDLRVTINESRENKKDIIEKLLKLQQIHINEIKAQNEKTKLDCKFQKKNMQEEHEVNKHFILEKYRNRTKDMENELKFKHRKLQEML